MSTYNICTSNEYPQHMLLQRNEKNVNAFGLKKPFYLELCLWHTKYVKVMCSLCLFCVCVHVETFFPSLISLELLHLGSSLQNHACIILIPLNPIFI